MKLFDKIFKKENKPIIDENIVIPPINGELEVFADVSCIQWLFNKVDEDNYTYYVYKIKYSPYLYASVQLTPSNQYSIRIFSYIGSEKLNKDNLFKVKRGKYQINYVITGYEIKLCESNNNEYSYEFLWNEIIEQYWKYVNKEINK